MLLASVKLLSFSFASGEFVAPTNTLGMCTREKCRLHANRATRLIVRLWLTCCPADEEILTKNLTGAIRFSRNVTEVPKAYNFITRWPPRCATIDRRKKCQTLFLRLARVLSSENRPEIRAGFCFGAAKGLARWNDARDVDRLAAATSEINAVAETQYPHE